MKLVARYSWSCALVFGSLVASSALAASQEFNFKDPKSVNSVSFFLDSVVEPIMGVAAGISGTVTFDSADPKAMTGKIVVDAASLHMENKGMKDTLHGPDWLDVKKHPRIEFTFKKVTDVQSGGENVFAMTVVGDLSCKGVTKEITVPVKATYLPGKLGERTRGQSGDLMVLRSNFVIKRSDFGIKAGEGGMVVAEEIELRVSIAGGCPNK